MLLVGPEPSVSTGYWAAYCGRDQRAVVLTDIQRRMNAHLGERIEERGHDVARHARQRGIQNRGVLTLQETYAAERTGDGDGHFRRHFFDHRRGPLFHRTIDRREHARDGYGLQPLATQLAGPRAHRTLIERCVFLAIELVAAGQLKTHGADAALQVLGPAAHRRQGFAGLHPPGATRRRPTGLCARPAHSRSAWCQSSRLRFPQH